MKQSTALSNSLVKLKRIPSPTFKGESDSRGEKREGEEQEIEETEWIDNMEGRRNNFYTTFIGINICTVDQILNRHHVNTTGTYTTRHTQNLHANTCIHILRACTRMHTHAHARTHTHTHTHIHTLTCTCGSTLLGEACAAVI